ncbi:unnamed protein product [Parnassius mnemosyne]|uniref:Uncharacterized protein n=2 Tax=Parnassius mnemosyne TaxID=213953 RepID=A0AAV1LX59_9NEOP
MAVSEQIDFSLLISKDFPVVENLAKSAAIITLHKFEWRFITFVFFNTSMLCGIDLFSKTYGKSVIVGHGAFYPQFSGNTHQYVLFGTDIQNINLMLEWMQKHQFDNTGKYVVVCISKEDCDESEGVKMLWNYKIINVVFLKTGLIATESMAYTYFYKHYDCEKVQPVKLDNWLSCIYIDHGKDCLEMFPLKLKNLQSCPIIVSTFAQTPYMMIKNGVPSGADGDLLRLIVEKLNASLQLMTPHQGFGWGKLEENGTWSGSLADVYYDLANFSMTSATITLSRFSYFHMSMDYNTVNVVWVTHPSAMESPSLKLIRPFEFEVRITLALSFLFVVLVAVIIKRKYWSSVFKAINISLPRRSLVFYSWEICMGLPSTKLPTKSSFLCLALFWIWYCFLIRTFYTVFLIKALKTNVYYSDMQKIEDALAANYGIGGGNALKDYFIDEPKIYNRWINFESNEIYLAFMNMSEGAKIVIAVNLETTKLFQRNQSKHLYILPQKVISTPTVIFFKKYSPLTEAINTILKQLIETGFVSKIYKIYTKSWFIKKSGHQKKAFTVAHFTGCYAVLIGGWIISFIFFIVELYMGQRRKSK